MGAVITCDQKDDWNNCENSGKINNSLPLLGIDIQDQSLFQRIIPDSNSVLHKNNRFSFDSNFERSQKNIAETNLSCHELHLPK